MNFAKHTFDVSGIFGLIALLPQYFLETKNGIDFPLPITHTEQDVLLKSPVRKVKLLDAHIRPPRILTIDKQKVYLMACAQPLRNVASLMVELGLCPSEILNLKRNDISLEQKITC